MRFRQNAIRQQVYNRFSCFRNCLLNRKKTKNGALGMDENNQVIPNLPEKLSGYGYISGIVTTDNLDGATPAAFFAHQPERGMSKEIWADLPNSKLTFFSAGSYELFEKQAPNVQKEIKKEFTIIEEPNDKAIKKSKKTGILTHKKQNSFCKRKPGRFPSVYHPNGY
nr:alkaline phosphatase [Bacteroides xylanisolvens]